MAAGWLAGDAAAAALEFWLCVAHAAQLASCASDPSSLSHLAYPPAPLRQPPTRTHAHTH